MKQESKLQSKIINDLELHGWLVLKVMKGNKAGWPDIFAFRDRITIFIEAKAPDEDAKDLQKYVHALLRAQGFQVFVIDTWEMYLRIKEDCLV